MDICCELGYPAYNGYCNCEEDEWICKDGSCISSNDLCNGSDEIGNADYAPDCPDGSDEDLDVCCEQKYEAYYNDYCNAEAVIRLLQDDCTSDQWACWDGSCIPDYWRCDVIVDCANGEDEFGCCDDDEFVCYWDGTCIPDD